MTIVETQNEVSEFLKHWNAEASIVVPIWNDLYKHPMNDDLSFLYIRFPHEDYILSYNHNDCVNVDCDLSNSIQLKTTYNKKGLLQEKLGIHYMRDMQAELFFNQHNEYHIEPFLERLTTFYHRVGLHNNLGKSIPIMKFGEVLREFTNDISYSVPDSWVDNTLIPVLSRVEESGISVIPEKFIDRWPSAKKQLNGNRVYTEYNPYTLTSRPSNRHGGVNYSALNKKDGSRDIFVPNDNHIFLQFDYDAYHVRIIGKMIGYELPKTSVHKWLADLYGVSYDESKNITFRILYGGVQEEYKSIRFFELVDIYIRELYAKAEKRGYVETMRGRKIPLKWIADPNPQKVFNYLLQATETEYNISVISELLKSGFDNMVLYTYDSFLFEFDKETDYNKALDIKNIIEMYDFPVKASWGTTYSKV